MTTKISSSDILSIRRVGEFPLIDPHTHRAVRYVDPKALFELIVDNAHHNGEPGVLFIDAANRSNPVPTIGQYEATNPCVIGETLVTTPSGLKRVDAIKVGDTITTASGGAEKVDRIETHTGLEVFQVTFDDGASVTATASHQFYVWEASTKRLKPKMVKNLHVGETVRTLVGNVGVASITPAGRATVYDVHEPKTDTWITNGIVSRGCGEQWLLPYESCNLGSLNLAKLPLINGAVDWETLQSWVETAVLFLDDVVTANNYVPSVPKLAETALNVRRIGLGIMGFADLLFKLGLRYGSDEAQDFAAQLMEFIRFHAMHQSMKLAYVYDPFPALPESIYSEENFKFNLPYWPASHSFKRPELNWLTLLKDIKKYGIRNGAQLTIAPTGTIATVAGCEGYGCEPVFALAYQRHVNDKGQDLVLAYTSPLFDQALAEVGLPQAKIEAITQEVSLSGSCQNIADVPEMIKRVFVCSSDISGEEHVKMQAALQVWVDNSISKTIGLPATATKDDVAKIYRLAWELGCKGLTVYVAGSRDRVVLETQHTPALKAVEDKKTRPELLVGQTRKLDTPLGTLFVTVNEDELGPFEVFLVSAKAGSETTAISEAIGRLVSLILRMNSTLSRRTRLAEVVRQLRGIGGSNHVGFGPRKVKSLPDGIAIALEKYLAGPGIEAPKLEQHNATRENRLDVHICPECGEASLVLEEGCEKCRNCGFSKC